MATPQNLTAVHVACRKRTECRRKTILYFTEICRKVKSYIEEAILNLVLMKSEKHIPIAVGFSVDASSF